MDAKKFNEMNDAVEEVFALYHQFGDEDYIGEQISQIEHMSQAAELAMLGGFDDEIVLAAFFHDIGHLVDSNGEHEKMGLHGVSSHEDLGAQFLLRKGFSVRVAELVKSHVETKRYLVYKNPDYYHQLSEASRATLMYQGGPMNEEEAFGFEKKPDKDLLILMRKWDDEAKKTNKPLIDLEIIKQKALLNLSKRDAAL